MCQPGGPRAPLRGKPSWWRSCVIRTSCKSTTWAISMAGRTSRWSWSRGEPGPEAGRQARRGPHGRLAAGCARGSCRRGASGRDCPPRPEAVQRPACRRRRSQDQRFRPGSAVGDRAGPDPERGAAGDAELYGPRTGPGQIPRGGAGDRSVCARCYSLRTPRGPSAVPCGVGSGDRPTGPFRRSHTAFAIEPQRTARPGDHLPQVSAQGRAPAVRHCGRSGR